MVFFKDKIVHLVKEVLDPEENGSHMRHVQNISYLGPHSINDVELVEHAIVTEHIVHFVKPE